MNRRTLFVTVLSIALLAWFLRGANLASVWGYVRTARADLLILSFVFMASTYWSRAVRWQYLLQPIGPTRFRTVFRAGVIGFAALALLPARAGDLLRPYLVARQENLPFSAAFATIVMERVLDLIAVLALMALYVWGFADRATLPPKLLAPIQISAALGGAAAVVLMAMSWILASHPERIGSIVLAAGRVLPKRMAIRLAEIASAFSAGFAVARSPRALFLSLVWSFPLWIAIAAETWAVTVALGIAMPFTGSFLLQAMLVVGVAVPTPGGVGSYHEAYRLGVTSFFGAGNDQAVAAAILVHAISYLPCVLAGVVFMIQDGMSVGRLGELAGVARDKEIPHTDEVPILRTPGR